MRLLQTPMIYSAICRSDICLYRQHRWRAADFAVLFSVHVEILTIDTVGVHALAEEERIRKI